MVISNPSNQTWIQKQLSDKAGAMQWHPQEEAEVEGDGKNTIFSLDATKVETATADGVRYHWVIIHFNINVNINTISTAATGVSKSGVTIESGGRGVGGVGVVGANTWGCMARGLGRVVAGGGGAINT